MARFATLLLSQGRGGGHQGCRSDVHPGRAATTLTSRAQEDQETSCAQRSPALRRPVQLSRGAKLTNGPSALVASTRQRCFICTLHSSCSSAFCASGPFNSSGSSTRSTESSTSSRAHSRARSKGNSKGCSKGSKASSCSSLSRSRKCERLSLIHFFWVFVLFLFCVLKA